LSSVALVLSNIIDRLTDKGMKGPMTNPWQNCLNYLQLKIDNDEIGHLSLLFVAAFISYQVPSFMGCFVF